MLAICRNADTGQVNIYNEETNKADLAVQLPTWYNHFCVCPYPDGLVFIGQYKKVFLVNARTKMILYLPDLPEIMVMSAIVYHPRDDCLYVAGGAYYQNNILKLNDNVFKLSMSTRTDWEELPPMQRPLRHQIALINKDNLYLIGGRSEQIDDHGTKDVQRFRLSTQTWDVDFPLHKECSVINSGGVVSGNYLIVLTPSCVMMYDTLIKNCWMRYDYKQMNTISRVFPLTYRARILCSIRYEDPSLNDVKMYYDWRENTFQHIPSDMAELTSYVYAF